MAGWRLLIGDTDYSDYADFPTWRFFRSIRHMGSQANGSVVISGKAVPRPKGFQRVRFLKVNNDLSETMQFGGMIQRVSQKEIGPGTYEYELSCSDYTRWLDHYPVGASAYPRDNIGGGDPSTSGLDTPSNILIQILWDYAIRSTGNNTDLDDPPPAVPISAVLQSQGGYIQDMTDIRIGVFQVNYVPLTQAIDQLAKMVYAVWFVDENANFWFARPDATFLHDAPLTTRSFVFYNTDLLGDNPIGYSIAQLPTIDADNDTDVYADLTITEDVSTTISGVTPRDYMEASTEQLTQNQTTSPHMKGDGNTTFFALDHPPIDPKHTTVTLSGTKSKTYTEGSGNLKVEYVDGNPASPTADDWCFVCSTNKGIRFNVAPPAGTNIAIDYNYYFPGQDVMKNGVLAQEIKRREGFGPGMYYQVIADPTLTSPITINEGTPSWRAAEMIMLNRYSRIKLLAEWRSRKMGWRPGQVIGIISELRGDSEDAPFYNIWGQSFAMRMYLTQVEATIINDDTMDFRIEASSDIWGE